PANAGAHEVAVFLEGEDGKRYEIDRIKVDQIFAEDVKSFSCEKVISNNVPRGLYRVAIVVDTLNQIEEHNETNNTIYGAKVFVKGGSLTPGTGARSPGFEIILSVLALIGVAFLIRKRI
ncbi:MAG: PGF-CTERM sorting domain-containing protein, partial [Archaeoglobaceae archaeon]|nr:PGF-CTERM sorting domain-containing protein [Archaeoglobaceae archaeon]MDW8118560.1 PGF-CTERM sorting domain-containing protein [Archaeoglobaceae archaeon]